MHLVALTGQDGADEVADGFFVFDQQDHFAAALIGKGRVLWCVDFDQFVDPRQINFEGAAFAWLAVDPDVSAALLDDSVHGGKAESCAATAFFRGVKGLENMGDGCFVHAHTGIGNGEHNVASGLHGDVVHGVSRIQIHIGSFQNAVGRLAAWRRERSPPDS